jgi:hypothetical protein
MLMIPTVPRTSRIWSVSRLVGVRRVSYEILFGVKTADAEVTVRRTVVVAAESFMMGRE